MLDMVEQWNKRNLIGTDWCQKLKTSLRQSCDYILGDYRLHVKLNSRIADHCGTHALSDPINSKLAGPCQIDNKQGQDHKHDLQCDRCEYVKTTFADLRDVVSAAIDQEQDSGAKENLLYERRQILSAEEKILELKRHQLRSQLTNEQRTDIIQNLEPGEALVVADFAQKWLPSSYREKQVDYYGKKVKSQINFSLFISFL
jgi:hypothetical protein